MGGADAIVFTGGIGENAPEIRRLICEGFEWAGLELDQERNTKCTGGCEGLISTDSSRLAAYTIPTDEELLIARDTLRCVHGEPATVYKIESHGQACSRQRTQKD
jgi:acetate kinase